MRLLLALALAAFSALPAASADPVCAPAAHVCAGPVCSALLQACVDPEPAIGVEPPPCACDPITGQPR